MNKFKILVADDDEDDFFLIKGVLQETLKNNSLQHVHDGKQLIDCLNDMLRNKQKFPDLILLDINMPRMDGIEALSIIKSTASISDIPVLIYSTSSCDNQMKQCLLLGANGFVTKGTSPDHLVLLAGNINSFLNELRTAPGSLFPANN